MRPITHANEKIAGTLGANVLIDPDTQSALGDAFERAIADLRYGAIAVNSWTAFVFAHPDPSLGSVTRRHARERRKAASAWCTTPFCSTASSVR